jgi:hypothetical protein
MKPHIVKVEMKTDAGERGYYFYWSTDLKKWTKAQQRALRGRNVLRAERWLKATLPHATWETAKQDDGGLPAKYLKEDAKVVLLHPKYTFGSNTPPRMPSTKGRRPKAPVIVLPEFTKPVQGGFVQELGDVSCEEMEGATGDRTLDVRLGADSRPISLSVEDWRKVVAKIADIEAILKAYEEKLPVRQAQEADVMRVAINNLVSKHRDELQEELEKARRRRLN